MNYHSGNTAADTRGCILVGENLKKGMVLNSRRALTRLMQLLDSRKPGEPTWIEIKRESRRHTDFLPCKMVAFKKCCYICTAKEI